MQKITPFLWFVKEAETASKFYVSIFPQSKMLEIHRYGKEGPGKAGSVMTVSFLLAGQKFIALNGGPVDGIKFSLATSFFVRCRTQAVIDRYWKRLSAGGKILNCGWVTDRYGLTWQIVPEILLKLLGDKDRAAAGRTMKAMMGMRKFNIAGLKRAHAGK